jgi:hypothetical protein
MRYSLLAALPALAAASPTFSTETIHKDAAPVLSSTLAKEVPNSYMIVFKKHVKDHHAKDHHDWVQSIHTKSSQERMELRKKRSLTTEIFDGLKHTYNMAGMMGYSGHFDDETIEAIRRHPDVSQLALYPVLSNMHLLPAALELLVPSSCHSWRLESAQSRGWAYLRRQLRPRNQSQSHVTLVRYSGTNTLS